MVSYSCNFRQPYIDQWSHPGRLSTARWHVYQLLLLILPCMPLHKCTCLIAAMTSYLVITMIRTMPLLEPATLRRLEDCVVNNSMLRGICRRGLPLRLNVGSGSRGSITRVLHASRSGPPPAAAALARRSALFQRRCDTSSAAEVPKAATAVSEHLSDTNPLLNLHLSPIA